MTYNNFEISLVVFMPNITTNHAITYTNIVRLRRSYCTQNYKLKLKLTHKFLISLGKMLKNNQAFRPSVHSKGNVTRDDSQRQFFAQHSVATLLRHCFEYLQHCCDIVLNTCNIVSTLQRCVAPNIVVVANRPV